MTIFDRLLTRNYNVLKVTILAIVIFLILAINFIDVLYLHKTFYSVLFDAISSLVLTCALGGLTFYIINKKEKQLKDQIEQLCEAYQYIGQINRKIDALLELDMASLDRSSNRPAHEIATNIFKQLVVLLQAQAGLLVLHPPLEFKIFINHLKNHEIKNVLEVLGRSNVKEFKHSQGEDNELFFKELGLAEEMVKKYDYIIKPVYMHSHDIGQMILLFKKNQGLEDRDFNIIRVFSFYLALNATFKPDFTLFKT